MLHQDLAVIFAETPKFEGLFVFNPFRVVFMVAWFYVCLMMTGWMQDHPMVSKRHKHWLNMLSLAFAPFVFFAIYAVNLYQEAERQKVSVWTMIKGIAAGSMMSFKKQVIGQQINSCITLLDSSGRDLDEIYGDGGRKNSASGAISMAETIIWDCLSEHASDILIDPVAKDKYSVRFRIDGQLRVMQEVDKGTCVAVVNSIKALSGMDIAERRKSQDGAFSARHDCGVASFRVASAGVVNGEKLSIRMLSSNTDLYQVDKIGMSPKFFKTLTETLEKQQGMILVCGPTGSGKTTSLYAMLSEINAFERNIISVEDPVEYSLENISQIEVNPKAGVTFAKALRGILRQDPDVICIGEIRDEETAQIAMQASHTGHLVLSSLHSNSNFSTIVRLMDLGIKPMLLASALDVIISQRLVRRLCENCKTQADLSLEQHRKLSSRGIDISKIMKPVGCRECNGTGYHGRIAIFDLLKLDTAIKERLFADGVSSGDVRQLGERIIKPGLRKEAMKHVFTGLTTFNEIKRVV